MSPTFTLSERQIINLCRNTITVTVEVGDKKFGVERDGWLFTRQAVPSEEEPDDCLNQNKRSAMSSEYVCPILAELLYRVHRQVGGQSWGVGLLRLFQSYNLSPVKAARATTLVIEQYLSLLDSRNDTYELGQVLRDGVIWFAKSSSQKLQINRTDKVAANERALRLFENSFPEYVGATKYDVASVLLFGLMYEVSKKPPHSVLLYYRNKYAGYLCVHPILPDGKAVVSYDEILQKLLLLQASERLVWDSANYLDSQSGVRLVYNRGTLKVRS